MSGVQSVDRAFRLLEAVGEEPSGLTELARRVDLPVSTASRLLGTLEDVGAVERVEELGIYRIGPLILTMASSADSSEHLKAVARPELEWLAATIDEASGLSVPTGYEMRYLDQVDADQAVQVRDWVGARLPMHLVSSGLVVVANWSADAVESFLDRGFDATTPSSVVDPEAIRLRLDRIRAAGVAWTVDELEPGITSVAAPILSAMGEVVGAVHLHGPTYRFPGDRRQKAETAVVDAAGRIADGLGRSSLDAADPDGDPEAPTPNR